MDTLPIRPAETRRAFIYVEEAAKHLLVTPRRVCQLLKANRIVGAEFIGTGRRGMWLIPVGITGKPEVIDRPDAPGPKPRRLR